MIYVRYNVATKEIISRMMLTDPANVNVNEDGIVKLLKITETEYYSIPELWAKVSANGKSLEPKGE